MEELNFGEVVLCCVNNCQMLSAGSFKGVVRRSLRLHLLCKYIFLIISAYRSPKMAFSSVKLEKMPFWGFHGQIW